MITLEVIPLPTEYTTKTIIYIIFKNRLPRLQNSLHVELAAIHETLALTFTLIQQDPIYIFTDSFSSLYLLNTQIRHPSLQNNHPEKLILQAILYLLQQNKILTYLHKVRAHRNIEGNEKVDALAKEGADLPCVNMTSSRHYHVHSAPYWLHCAEENEFGHTFKDPIRNFQKYLKDQELKQQ